MPKKLNILLISYYFPPSTAIGAVRVNALFSFLKRYGHNVKVISANFKTKNDVTIKKNRVGFHPSKYFRSIDKTIFSLYTLNNLKKLKKLSGKFDIVISSYKPIASIILGIFYKINNKKSKLFIEQRDLISLFGRKKRIFPLHIIDKTIDKFFLSFADEIIVVSPSSMRKADVFYKKKTNLIFNGIDKLKNYHKPIFDKIKILYAGNLSSVRNLNRICKHIITCEKDIELIIASKENPKFFGGDHDFIKYKGFVNRDKLDTLIKEVNFLLILEGFDSDSEENIPGKLFEYLSFNKPIMANCSENSEIMKILSETQAGKNINKFSDFIDYIEAKQFKTNDSLKKYYRDYQLKKYLNLLEKYE